jgi:hypothetical protein
MQYHFLYLLGRRMKQEQEKERQRSSGIPVEHVH